MFGGPPNLFPWCGCWVPATSQQSSLPNKQFLPQVDLKSSTTILVTTSRTNLNQTFINDQDTELKEVKYTFPLYHGVSVVGFTCTVGSKKIKGVVKEKQQARVDYEAAVSRGETAGLLEQLPEASDVFTTSVGNVPPKEKIHVEIVYLDELKHDAETDGSRFTIPTIIAPRYGGVCSDSAGAFINNAKDKGGISISIDVTLDQGTIVRGLQSPSHPIAVTMGRTSSMDEDSFNTNQASATLTLGSTTLDQDFVIVVFAKGTDTPRALFETHPTIPNQHAVMATLVPKFNLPAITPEIVFVIDRSGSMQGKIELAVSAMRIFLKSLPVGVKFNICSFGSRHSFLFSRSKTYDQSSLKEALAHLDTFAANYGGTEMVKPVKATVENRYLDLPLEVMLLTDGEIWNQEELFTFVNQTANARFFTLGIGKAASTALVEGVARAGNGFAQFVGENEKIDKRLVRMLKGALSPHITTYTIDLNYGPDTQAPDDDDFEMVEATNTTTQTVVADRSKEVPKQTISLFDDSATDKTTSTPTGRYDHLPTITAPNVLQAPHKIPALYPFNRTTVYLLLGPECPAKTLNSVTLRGTCEHGPLELEIPIQDVGTGETLHQLAAKKTVHELEQGRGWIAELRDDKGELYKTSHEGKWDLMVEREAVKSGVMFQIAGKWCSFVAADEANVQQASGPVSEPPKRFGHAARGGFGMQGGAQTGMSSTSGSLFSSGATLFAAPARPAQNVSLFAGTPGPGGTHTTSVPNSGSALFSAQSPMARRTPNISSGGGLFGAPSHGTTPPSASSSAGGLSGPPRYLMQQQQYARPAPGDTPLQVDRMRSVAHTPSGSPASAQELADYQSSLMILNQENKKRKQMVPQSQASVPQAAALSLPPANVHYRKDLDATMCMPHPEDMDDESGNLSADARPLSTSEKMHKLIDLQDFDGSWQMSNILLELIGIPEDRFTGIDLGSDSFSQSKTHKATVLAVAWLKTTASTEEDVWEMVVEKAMGWLKADLTEDQCSQAVSLAEKGFSAS